MFHANAQQNGSSSDRGPVTGVVKWSFEGEGLYMMHSPLVGPEGTIYVQKGTGDYMIGNDAFYALSPEGKELWRWTRPGIRFSPGAITLDGSMLYTIGVPAGGKPDSSSTLFYVDTKTGKLIREVFLSNYYTETWMTHVAEDDKGNIYARGADVLNVYDPKGEKIWGYRSLIDRKLNYNPRITSGPTLSPDGKTVYLLFRAGGGLMAFDTATGKLRWHDKTWYKTDFSPAVVGLNGDIYITDDRTKSIFAVNPDGSRKWKVSFGDDKRLYNSFPAVGNDGTVYLIIEGKIVEKSNGYIYALDSRDGKIKWSYEFEPSRFATPPAIDRDGRIYAATGSGKVFCFTPDGEVLWKLLVGYVYKEGDDSGKRKERNAQIFMSGPVISNGMIYVIKGQMSAVGKGKLVAIGEAGPN
ncbi:MAG: PQQ-binding-like beta-propeller repeat protein [Deltaproteobacteria bacterium]|nr:PQQ-binding-like beta-propeller repeat protein [Deltaproteobacteria bacterium]